QSTCALVMSDPVASTVNLLRPDDGVVQSASALAGIAEFFCWGLPNAPVCNSSTGFFPTGGVPQRLCTEQDAFTIVASSPHTTLEERAAVSAMAMNGVEDLCVGKLRTPRTESAVNGTVHVSPIEGDGLVCFTGDARHEFPELAGRLVRKIALGAT